MRLGFLVWNEFQFFHIRSILSEFPDAVLFVDVRFGLHRRFPFSVLRGVANRIVKLHFSNLTPISELVDILVVQSKTAARKQLPTTKLVAMQYSLSKEWHQYGDWMQEADHVLCFGNYSREKLRALPKVSVIGNPRMDAYFREEFDPDYMEKISADLDGTKRTIMLAPSWNDSRLISQLQRSIPALQEHFNVLWSPHHNTKIHRNFLSRMIKRSRLYHDQYLYFLKLADIVVSDTSGALFDAVHASKAVIITDFTRSQHGRADSIEFSKRDAIGPVATNPNDLFEKCLTSASDSAIYFDRNNELRDMCFSHSGNASKMAARAILSIK